MMIFIAATVWAGGLGECSQLLNTGAIGIEGVEATCNDASPPVCCSGWVWPYEEGALHQRLTAESWTELDGAHEKKVALYASFCHYFGNPASGDCNVRWATPQCRDAFDAVQADLVELAGDAYETQLETAIDTHVEGAYDELAEAATDAKAGLPVHVGGAAPYRDGDRLIHWQGGAVTATEQAFMTSTRAELDGVTHRAEVAATLGAGVAKVAETHDMAWEGTPEAGWSGVLGDYGAALRDAKRKLDCLKQAFDGMADVPLDGAVDYIGGDPVLNPFHCPGTMVFCDHQEQAIDAGRLDDALRDVVDDVADGSIIPDFQTLDAPRGSKVIEASPRLVFGAAGPLGVGSSVPVGPLPLAWLDADRHLHPVTTRALPAADGSTEVDVVGPDGTLLAILRTPSADRDGDGVPDMRDECPDQAGMVRGCPDTDGDGVGRDDQCPNAAGLPRNGGCPDLDGDGLVVGDDCPDDAGQPSSRGCPDPTCLVTCDDSARPCIDAQRQQCERARENRSDACIYERQDCMDYATNMPRRYSDPAIEQCREAYDTCEADLSPSTCDGDDYYGIQDCKGQADHCKAMCGQLNWSTVIIQSQSDMFLGATPNLPYNYGNPGYAAPAPASTSAMTTGSGYGPVISPMCSAAWSEIQADSRFVTETSPPAPVWVSAANVGSNNVYVTVVSGYQTADQLLGPGQSGGGWANSQWGFAVVTAHWADIRTATGEKTQCGLDYDAVVMSMRALYQND
jgi:hypothetical protein